MVAAELKFGAFLPDIEPDKNNECFPRHILLIQALDQLGFDQVWIQANRQIQAADLRSFFAAASSSTDKIRFGLLLPTDLLPDFTKELTQIAAATKGRLSICLGLGTPCVDCESQTVLDCRQEDQDVSIGSQTSPNGARLAGQYGLGLLSIGATTAVGFDALPSNWEIYCRYAAKNEHVADRTRWSIVAPMHVADTKRAAIREVEPGFQEWLQHILQKQNFTKQDHNSPASISEKESMDLAIKSGTVVIGSAKSAIDQIKRLKAQTGGFGTLILMCHNWANSQDTLKSYQLFADRVIPKFRSARFD